MTEKNRKYVVELASYIVLTFVMFTLMIWSVNLMGREVYGIDNLFMKLFNYFILSENVQLPLPHN